MLRALGMMPWCSVSDLARLCEVDRSLVHRRLYDLRDAGYAGLDHLGCTRPRSGRWRLLGAAFEHLKVPDCLWGSDWALARLLDKLPQVEWFYPAAAGFQEQLGPMVRFRWFRGVSWDAAALYERGWVAFFWSGLLQAESRLREIFRRLGGEFEACRLSGPTPFPGLMCFVAADAWQRELVLRVARDYGLEDRVQITCVADGTVSGCREASVSRGWVGQVVEGGGLGNWPLAARLEGSEWADVGGVRLNLVLEDVMEWPGMTRWFGERACGGSAKSGWLRRNLLRLLDGGYLRRYHEGGEYRYLVEGKGMNLLGRRDGVNVKRFLDSVRHNSPASGRGHEAHEDGVLRLMGKFYEAGLEGAAGWRSWEHLGRFGGIAPDAMVRLGHGPYGPGWHYVEYELRARGRTSAEKKLRGYLSSRRGDRWPLLLVVRNGGMEEVFQGLGKAGGLRMLTSTVERLQRGEVTGGGGCWSAYGRLAALG